MTRPTVNGVTDWVRGVCWCGHKVIDHAPAAGHCMAGSGCCCAGPLTPGQMVTTGTADIPHANLWEKR